MKEPTISQSALLVLGGKSPPATAGTQIIAPPMSQEEERILSERAAALRSVPPATSQAMAVLGRAVEEEAGRKEGLGQNDPTTGMTNWELAKAGAKIAAEDLALGGLQRVGSLGQKYLGMAPEYPLGEIPGISYEDIRKKRERDAPIKNKLAAIIGGALPAAALPAISFGAGALRAIPALAATGAAYSLLQPVTKPEELLPNVGQGAVIGALAGAVPAVLGGAGTYIAGIGRPQVGRGPERVAGSVLARTATAPESNIRPVIAGEAADLTRGSPGVSDIAPAQARLARLEGAMTARTETGAIPTLAEVTESREIARLQDALEATPGVGSGISEAYAANNLARISSLERIAKTPAEREALDAAREAAAEPLYTAFKTQPAIEITPKMAEILRRPHIKSMIREAEEAAANRPGAPPFGLNFDPKTGTGTVTGEALHDIKRAIDTGFLDQTKGWVGEKGNQLKATQKELIAEMDAMPVSYAPPRTVYQEASRPLNQAEIARGMRERGIVATPTLTSQGVGDVLSHAKLRAMISPRAGERALGEQALIRAATGTKAAGNKLEEIFIGTPQAEADLNTLRRIAGEVRTQAAVKSAGAGTNSATAQRLAYQDMLARMTSGGKLAESGLGQKIFNPLGFTTKALERTEPAIQNALARAMVDPAYAAELVRLSRSHQLPPELAKYSSAIGRGLQDIGTKTGSQL